MERRALLISIGLSLFSMYLVYQYVSNEDRKLNENYGKFVEIVVATRDILQFEAIRPNDIEQIRVPNAMVPPGYTRQVREVIDAVAAIPISKGEHVLDNKIISKNIYSGLDTLIAQNRRAISIPVNVRSALSYMLRPGSRVDLAAHFEYKEKKAAISEVKVFLQDLLVLAAGRTIQTNPPEAVDQNLVRQVMESKALQPSPTHKTVRDTLNYAKTEGTFQTITLEVTPQQAQIIIYVMTVFSDSIICLLRHPDDRNIQRLQTANLRDVMGADSFLVKGPKAEPPKATVLPKYYDVVGGRQVPVYGR